MQGEPGRFDVAIIGGGIAGASVASELATSRRVALLERESQPGYHTTGRSAALFSQTYGPPAIRALSRASSAFLHNPAAGFSEHRLLSPRGVMMVARADQTDALEGMLAETGGGFSRLTAAETRQRVPLLRDGYAAASLYEEDARDIDVHALHHGYLRRFRAEGGTIFTDAEILSIEPGSGGWLIATAKNVFPAEIVVNAAGAWADQMARMAGAQPVGLVPKRRTAAIVAAPDGQIPDHWPMTVDIDEEFYLKPDAGRLLISPADETPSPPCDAQPDEFDIAVCVDRIETAFDLSVRRIENKWAGLRSFVADKTPVAGFDPEIRGFYWLAGQGGYGIQSAPGLAAFAAAQILGRPLPQWLADHGVEPAALDPARFNATGQSGTPDVNEPKRANGR